MPLTDDCCPECGGEIRQVTAGLGDTPLSDMAWPECNDCDWRGAP